MTMITRDQIRAARALLDWSQPQLAELAQVSTDLVSKIENGVTDGSIKTLKKIQNAIEYHGIEFIENDGVKRSAGSIRELRGRTGFIEFMWDVYDTVKNSGGGEVCVSNVSEDLFEYWLGDRDKEYTAKMREIPGLNFKILIEREDTNFAASTYAEYRWIKKELFSSVPFYVYGNKLALILFKQDVTIFMIENEEIAVAQRNQFRMTWDNAEIPVYRHESKSE